MGIDRLPLRIPKRNQHMDMIRHDDVSRYVVTFTFEILKPLVYEIKSVCYLNSFNQRVQVNVIK